VGWINAAIKDVHGAPVGDTLTHAGKPAEHPLPGFQTIKPRVFAGRLPDPPAITPACARRWTSCSLNDAALLTSRRAPRRWASAFAAASWACCTWRSCRSAWSASTTSDLITTAPTVVYEVLKTDGTVLPLDNPAKLPPVPQIEEIREPIIMASILYSPDYVGTVMTLCEEKRGVQRSIQYLGEPGAAAPTNCRWPRWCWTSSTA
jgi:GTP-binding protein LepA